METKKNLDKTFENSLFHARSILIFSIYALVCGFLSMIVFNDQLVPPMIASFMIILGSIGLIYHFRTTKRIKSIKTQIYSKEIQIYREIKDEYLKIYSEIPPELQSEDAKSLRKFLSKAITRCDAIIEENQKNLNELG